MAEFIKIQQGERDDIFAFAGSYKEQAVKRQKRETDEMARILFKNADGSIDGSRYGLGSGNRFMSDRNTMNGFLKAWYVYKGMSEDVLFSDSQQAQEEKNRLTEEFHKTFSLQPNETPTMLRERRHANILAMKNMLDRRKLVLPDLDEGFTKDNLESYVNRARLESDMTAGVEEVFFETAFRDFIPENLSGRDPIRDSMENGRAHRNMAALAESFIDVFSTQAFINEEPLTEETTYENYDEEKQDELRQKESDLRKALGRISGYKRFVENANVADYANTPMNNIGSVPGEIVPTNGRDYISAAIENGAVRNDYSQYAALFDPEYTAPENNSRRGLNINDSINPMMFSADPEQFLRQIAGNSDSPIDDVLKNIYINGTDLSEYSGRLDSAAAELKAALSVDNRSFVGVLNDNGSMRPITLRFSYSEHPENQYSSRFISYNDRKRRIAESEARNYNNIRNGVRGRELLLDEDEASDLQQLPPEETIEDNGEEIVISDGDSREERQRKEAILNSRTRDIRLIQRASGFYQVIDEGNDMRTIYNDLLNSIDHTYVDGKKLANAAETDMEYSAAAAARNIHRYAEKIRERINDGAVHSNRADYINDGDVMDDFRCVLPPGASQELIDKSMSNLRDFSRSIYAEINTGLAVDRFNNEVSWSDVYGGTTAYEALSDLTGDTITPANQGQMLRTFSENVLVNGKVLKDLVEDTPDNMLAEEIDRIFRDKENQGKIFTYSERYGYRSVLPMANAENLRELNEVARQSIEHVHMLHDIRRSYNEMRNIRNNDSENVPKLGILDDKTLKAARTEIENFNIQSYYESFDEIKRLREMAGSNRYLHEPKDNDVYKYINELTGKELDKNSSFEQVMDALSKIYVNRHVIGTEKDIKASFEKEGIEKCLLRSKDFIEKQLKSDGKCTIRIASENEGKITYKQVLGREFGELENYSAKSAMSIDDRLRKARDLVYKETTLANMRTVSNMRFISDVLKKDGDELLKTVLGRAVTPENETALLGKIYVNGKNISSYFSPNDFNKENVAQKLKELLDPKKSDIITVMDENSVNARPLAIVAERTMELAQAGGRPGEACRERLINTNSFVNNFRRDIEDTFSRFENQRDPESIPSKKAMVFKDFMAFTDRENEVKTNLEKVGIPKDEKRKADIMITYMMSEGYSPDRILEDSPEMKAARREAGRNFCNIFSPPQMDGETLDMSSPEGRAKYDDVIYPTLKRMSEMYLRRSVPYVDFSDKESVKNNCVNAKVMLDIGDSFEKINVRKDKVNILRGVAPREQMKYFESRYEYMTKRSDSRTSNKEAAAVQAEIDAKGNYDQKARVFDRKGCIETPEDRNKRYADLSEEFKNNNIKRLTTISYSEFSKLSDRPEEFFRRLTGVPVSAEKTQDNLALYNKALDMIYINGRPLGEQYRLHGNEITSNQFLDALHQRSATLLDHMKKSYLGTGNNFIQIKDRDGMLIPFNIDTSAIVNKKPEKVSEFGVIRKFFSKPEAIKKNQEEVQRYKEDMAKYNEMENIKEVVAKRNQQAASSAKYLNDSLGNTARQIDAMFSRAHQSQA